MRTTPSRTITLLALLFSIASARAESPAIKLPRERGWAQYHAIAKPEGRAEVIGKLTLKSLNKTTIDGVPCHWFETEYVATEYKRHERSKFLIPEQAVMSSARPMESALRFLQQDDDAPVGSLPPDSTAWMATNFLHYPGFLKNAKRVDDPRTVKYQRGTLEIPQAHVGTYQWWPKDRVPADSAVNETTYRVWMHPDLPAGYAHATMTLKFIRQGQTTRTWHLEYALQDFGDKAEPAITAETAPPLKP